MSIMDTVTNPKALEAVATLAGLTPAPVGPMLAAVLRLAEAALAAGHGPDEIDAITARYSAKAQAIADSWGNA